MKTIIGSLGLNSSRRRQSGQLLPIAAVAFILMCGLAGLAIDSSRDYLMKRQAQNAVDFATLAAAKQMSLSGGLNAPLAPNSNAVMVAHDFAANNGFSTVYSNGCDSSTGASFSATWFDVGGVPCNATSGFTNKVTINSPPVQFASYPVPAACSGAGQYACLQVVITTGIPALHEHPRHRQRLCDGGRHRSGDTACFIIQHPSTERADPLPAAGRLRHERPAVLQRKQTGGPHIAGLHRWNKQLPDVLDEGERGYLRLRRLDPDARRR